MMMTAFMICDFSINPVIENQLKILNEIFKIVFTLQRKGAIISLINKKLINFPNRRREKCSDSHYPEIFIMVKMLFQV